MLTAKTGVALTSVALIAILVLPTATPVAASSTYDKQGERWFYIYSPDSQNAVALRYSIDLEFLIGQSNSTVYLTEFVTVLSTGQAQLGYGLDATDVVLGNLSVHGPTAYSMSCGTCVFSVPFVTGASIDIGMGQVFQLSNRHTTTCACIDPAVVYSLTLGYINVKLSNNQTVTLALPGEGVWSLYTGGDVAYNSPSTLTMFPDYSSQSLQNLTAVQSPLVKEVASLQAQVSSLQGQVQSLDNQLANLQSQYNNLENQYNALTTSNSALQGEYSTLKSQYAILSTNFTSLETSYSTAKLTLTETQSNFTAMQLKYNQSQANNAGLESSLSNLNSTLSALQTRYDSLSAENATLSLQLVGLHSNLIASENRNSTYLNWYLPIGIAIPSFVAAILLIAVARRRKSP